MWPQTVVSRELRDPMEAKSRRRDTRVGGGSYGACLVALPRQSILLRGQIERARNRKASFESRFHRVLGLLARRLDGCPVFKKGSSKESVKEFFCLITGKKLVTVTASNGVHTLLIYVRKGMTGRAIAPWPELPRSTASRKDSPIVLCSLTVIIQMFHMCPIIVPRRSVMFPEAISHYIPDAVYLRVFIASAIYL
ncbi:hypothetical protein HZH68_007694 [Vespula germanica]|uniref:Uncharacterized protein n=1 Tax=Vespula germanica TaxID=30212 RepID=A0A834K476_VESGE|nr:hypothetical protein HZH68_007694 [Vespula germanica]